MFPAARIGDPVTHDMNAPSGVIGPAIAPPVAGPVFIEGMPAAHVTCTVVCSGATSAAPAHPPPPGGAPPPPIVVGEPTVFINGFPAARWAPSGDTAACGAFLGDAKLLATRSVFIGSASSGETKSARWQTRKWLIAVGLAKAGALADGDEKVKLKSTAERFTKNNQAIEKARLAENVYVPGAPPPEGWKNISGDPIALDRIGLKPDDLTMSGSEFRAQVYAPDPSVFGNDMKTTIAIRGTQSKFLNEGELGEDWSNNLAQGQDEESPYYRKAVKMGNRLSKSGADVELAGHSLGGGLVSAASRASGRPATTFNSAGLRENTVTRYGGTPHDLPVENIQAYRVQGEVLTGLQEQGLLGTLAAAKLLGPMGALAKIALSAQMPDAVGTPHEVEGSWDPVSRHAMTQVLAGIEAQKAEDLAALTGTF